MQLDENSTSANQITNGNSFHILMCVELLYIDEDLRWRKMDQPAMQQRRTALIHQASATDNICKRNCTDQIKLCCEHVYSVYTTV